MPEPYLSVTSLSDYHTRNLSNPPFPASTHTSIDGADCVPWEHGQASSDRVPPASGGGLPSTWHRYRLAGSRCPTRVVSAPVESAPATHDRRTGRAPMHPPAPPLRGRTLRRPPRPPAAGRRPSRLASPSNQSVDAPSPSPARWAEKETDREISSGRGRCPHSGMP